VTRRSLKPLDGFIDRLADAAGSSTNGADWRRGNELRQLEAALAMREQSEAQRVTILEQMAQQERDGLLARMAASIAHEVRNPLAGLKNGISTLKRFGDREDVRKETLAFLENGLDSIGRVVDVTLSTYRRRSGSRMITAQDIRDLEILIAPEAGRAGVGLAWTFEEPTEFWVDVDALRQILINLMLNAVRASPPGSTVTVSLTRKDAQTVVLSVADEGPGMPPEIVAAMISGRVNDIPVERSIGIWIVASLVERMGADLSIRSDSTGTNVQLTLVTAQKGGAET
jgi:signal transduction histidine kinase